ncbi:MAG: M23 family metallopeptidase [Defluviitaleaceae bacterium]|nr:M23 family metallopeptidase [Defluviitaleaceae bacterium]
MPTRKRIVTMAIAIWIFHLLALRVSAESSDHIRWMEFDVPVAVMSQAMDYDVKYYGTDTSIYWVDLIAYGAARHWGKFPRDRRCAHIDSAVEKITEGQNFEDLTEGLKLFPFYREAYGAVLSGMVGEYEQKISSADDSGGEVWERRYGLRAFFPLARGYNYSHFDDFGARRSYGYSRPHLGHDFMSNVGTPIIAVEDGYVEALGWNRYGGWRVGVRSVDRQRYYYYAHLRRDHPFHKTVSEGGFVRAGDVLGYVGMTGYSRKENVNNISVPHLHFGLQIIFDESQKDGNNQIWVDVYDLVRFLSKNKMPVRRNEQTRDFERTFETNSIAND